MSERLEDLKSRRTKVNHRIAWCWVCPPLGWFGRYDRLHRDYDRLNKEVRAEIRHCAQVFD